MDNLSVQGVWWDPSRHEVDPDSVTLSSGLPDGVVAGEATFRPTVGGTLEIIGFLGEDVPDPNQAEEFPNANFLHGISTSGRKITLENCVATNIERVMSQVTSGSQSWYFERIYDGEHIGESVVEEVEMQFSGLEKWANFEFEIPLPGQEGDFSIQSEERSAKVGEVEITVRGIRRPDPHSFSSGTDEARVTFRHDDRILITEFITDYVFPLQSFLTLALGKPVYPREITGKLHESEFDVFYHQNTHEEGLNYGIPIFGAREIDFEPCLTNWYEFADTVPEVISLVFGTHFEQPKLSHLEFLSLIISLEAVHRRYYPEQHQMDPRDFQSYRDEALQSLPDGPAKERIVDLINSIGNQPSLRERLEAIGDEHENVLSRIFDPEELFRKAVDLRHALAHGLETVDERELMIINPTLRVTLHTIMYGKLGFEGDRLLAMVLSMARQKPVHVE